jgi:hyperosmotically inducible protein
MMGCSVRSAIKNTVETAYKVSVDERSLIHIVRDKRLTTEIMAEILKDDMTNILDITAECYYGYPFIIGECNNLEEAQRVMDIAERITGKTPIPSLMKKGGEDDDCNPAVNLKIATEVKALLVADKKIFATNVVVKSVHCQAILLGVLGSKESIIAAIEHAEGVGGVKKVHSFLVSTDTGRSWDSVFKALGKTAEDSTEKAISDKGEANPDSTANADEKPFEKTDIPSPPAEPEKNTPEADQTVNPDPTEQ